MSRVCNVETRENRSRRGEPKVTRRAIGFAEGNLRRAAVSRLGMSLPLLLVSVLALAPAAAKSDVLPLRKLRIYETGVAYYERHGTLSTVDPASLPVPAGHLDDALKTLVIVEHQGQAKIRNIAFASTVSEALARTMAGLPTDSDAPLDFETLLRSLEGLPVDVRLGKTSIRGRLLEVQGPFRPTPPLGGDAAGPSPTSTSWWSTTTVRSASSPPAR